MDELESIFPKPATERTLQDIGNTLKRIEVFLESITKMDRLAEEIQTKLNDSHHPYE